MMAFSLHFAGRFLLRNNIISRASNCCVTKQFSSEFQQNDPKDEEPSSKPVNIVRWSGIAVDGCNESYDVFIKNRSNYKLRVRASKNPLVRKIFNEIEPGMNVYIEGELHQKTGIKEIDSEFVFKTSEFIMAKRVELLLNEEDVERKIEEKREIIYGSQFQS